MISASIVGFPYAHRVVSKVDIAVVACTGQYLERAPSDKKGSYRRVLRILAEGAFPVERG